MQRHHDEWEFLFEKLKAENELMRDCLRYVAMSGRGAIPHGVYPTEMELMSELANERLFDVSEARKCLAQIDKGEL